PRQPPDPAALASRSRRHRWALLAAKGSGTGLWQPNQPSSGELALAAQADGYRRIAQLVQADRQTVRRYVEAAKRVGLGRSGGDELLPHELLGRQPTSSRPRGRAICTARV